ncbi:MAG: hypothetical protein IPK66_04545 [Rhodospirillales bacterium]|nr:hypothetical protein [Rhodospirillales bacterium]
MFIDGISASTATSGGQSATDAQKLDTDINRFLTLLVTQLQNQDPLEPMDANQFTTQLVQFASVEQQIYQNANLEKLVSAQSTASLSSAVGFIGNSVEASGNALLMQDGQANSSYTLASNASNATITIKDAGGTIVYTGSGATAAGRHDFQWDGKSNDGRSLPDGVYTMQVSAIDKAGDAVAVDQTYRGTVTGVSTQTGSIVLSLGDVELPMNDVLSVSQPSASSG